MTQTTKPPAYWAELLPIPATGTINSGLTYGRPGTLLALLGSPATPLPTECGTCTNRKILGLLVTRQVGNMRLTALKPFLDAFERAFNTFQAAHPDVAALIGTAGGLCVRCVRGWPKVPSNHAAGTAIDLKVNGQLLPLAAPNVQRGILLFYPHLHREGLYWGASWDRPDAMHFEASNELLLKWRSQGLI